MTALTERKTQMTGAKLRIEMRKRSRVLALTHHFLARHGVNKCSKAAMIPATNPWIQTETVSQQGSPRGQKELTVNWKF